MKHSEDGHQQKFPKLSIKLGLEVKLYQLFNKNYIKQ